MKIDPVQAVYTPSGRLSVDSDPVGKPQACTRLVEVVFREFANTSGGVDALESILQSHFESTSRIIKNMVMTPEERRAVEERRAKIEKLREDVKERKLDEQEARIELGRLLSEEDKKALEFTVSERIVYS